MFLEILKKEDLDVYRAFLQKHPKGHFMQSPEWGEVKNEWKWDAVVEKNAEGAIIGGVSVLTRPVPCLPTTLMYAPRGPVCDPADTDTLAKLVGGLRALAVKNKAYLIKMDPDILKTNEAFTKSMEALSFQLHDGGKNFDEIQPRFVFRLNIEGKTQDEIFAGFSSKTRYNVRLAKRRGVEVKICPKETLSEFVPIMRTTGERDGFATRPQAYFERMLDAFGLHARLYMAYHEGKPIAGTVAIQYGDKVWYLYGASANEYRNLMPNYLLQWEMIRWAQETHCRIYDFRGVSGDLNPDNPLYGLYRFKKGFNGNFTEFAGEYNLILNAPMEKLVDTGISVTKTLRHLKNRRHPAGKK